MDPYRLRCPGINQLEPVPDSMGWVFVIAEFGGLALLVPPQEYQHRFVFPGMGLGN